MFLRLLTYLDFTIANRATAMKKAPTTDLRWVPYYTFGPVHHCHTRTFLMEFHQMQPQIFSDPCLINSKTPCCYFMFSWAQFFWSIAKAQPIGLFCSRSQDLSSQVSARACLSIVSLIDGLHAAAAPVLATEGLVWWLWGMPVLTVAGQQQVHLERFLSTNKKQDLECYTWASKLIR